MQTWDTVEGLYIFFPFKYFLYDRNKIDEGKKIMSNTIDNEMSLTTFSVILNISSKAIKCYV